MRDSQRQRCYDAENVLRIAFDYAAQTESRTYNFFGSHLTLPIERKFGEVEGVQAYVTKVLNLRWVQETFKQAQYAVTVRERQGQDKAHYCAGEIAVPVLARWALREIVVLHEIAHHFTPADPGHGAQFAGAFYTLVTEIIGPEAGLILSWAMSEKGVKVACA